MRKPEQLAGLSGLIIPGGESTTMAKLAEHYKMVSVSHSHTFSFRYCVMFCCYCWVVVQCCHNLFF